MVPGEAVRKQSPGAGDGSTALPWAAGARPEPGGDATARKRCTRLLCRRLPRRAAAGLRPSLRPEERGGGGAQHAPGPAVLQAPPSRAAAAREDHSPRAGDSRRSQLAVGCLGHDHQLGQLGPERPRPVGHCERRKRGKALATPRGSASWASWGPAGPGRAGKRSPGGRRVERSARPWEVAALPLPDARTLTLPVTRRWHRVARPRALWGLFLNSGLF